MTWSDGQAGKKGLPRVRVVEMIERADRESDRAIVAMLYLTGCRNNELVRIRRKDVEVVEDGIKIKVRYSKKSERSEHRGDKHEVFVGEDAPFADHIRGWVGRFEGPDAYLFQGCGENLSERQVRNIVSDFFEVAFPHRFRKNRITRLADQDAKGNRGRE